MQGFVKFLIHPGPGAYAKNKLKQRYLLHSLNENLASPVTLTYIF